MYLENFKYSINVSNSPLMPLLLLASVLENLGPDLPFIPTQHADLAQFCACFCQAFQEYQLMKANLYVNFLAWGSYIMQVL